MDVLHVDCDVVSQISKKILKKKFLLECKKEKEESKETKKDTDGFINIYLLNLGCSYKENCRKLKEHCNNKKIKF